MKEDSSASTTKHTPPLGHASLTPLYDVAIATLTREKRWRHELIAAIAPKPGDRILDIGSGKGSLSAALHHDCAGAHYIGVDPDREAILRARRKTAESSGGIQFVHGYFTPERNYFEQPPNKIVSSLVLHQIPSPEKRRIIIDARDLLAPGGSIFIADYGLQKGVMRTLFRWTVQSLDWRRDYATKREWNSSAWPASLKGGR